MIKNIYWFSAPLAHRILDALDKNARQIHISVDLNLTQGTFPLTDDELVLDAKNRLNREALQQIAAKENRIFVLED